MAVVNHKPVFQQRNGETTFADVGRWLTRALWLIVLSWPPLIFFAVVKHLVTHLR